MRILMLIAAALIALPAAASAQNTAPSAQALYVERSALLDTDARCRLFSANVRFALEAGADQAAGALLRSGWTRARLDELEQASLSAARHRPCGDPRTAAAAHSAEAGFASWTRTYRMTFTGGERAWFARRSPDIYGWRLYQQIPSPTVAILGVREIQNAQQLTFALPAAERAAAPASAQLVMRDPARAGVEMLDLRGRLTRGLDAGLPSPHAAQRFFANSRRVEHPRDQAAQIMFTFPDAAFQRLLTLDPRETIAIDLDISGRTQRFLVEVGDVAAARAFLAIDAEG